jgi:hypothetical protein
VRAELHGVRRQREIGVAVEAGIVAGGQTHREALDRGKPAGGVKP